VIGGEATTQAEDNIGGVASTEPPIVIGGETIWDEMQHLANYASTEPPIVIGGEVTCAGGTLCAAAALQRSRRS